MRCKEGAKSSRALAIIKSYLRYRQVAAAVSLCVQYENPQICQDFLIHAFLAPVRLRVRRS